MAGDRVRGPLTVGASSGIFDIAVALLEARAARMEDAGREEAASGEGTSAAEGNRRASALRPIFGAFFGTADNSAAV